MSFDERLEYLSIDKGGSTFFNVEHTDFGVGAAAGDGVTNATAALVAADAAGGAQLRAGRTYVTETAELHKPFSVNGGMLKPASGETVTINRLAVVPGAYQWIDLSDGGEVEFAAGSTTDILPQWFGPTVNETTIMAAINAASGSGATVRLPGAVQLGGSIALNAITDITIAGAGANATLLVVNGDYSCFDITGLCSRIRFKDFCVVSFESRADGYAFSVINTTGTPSDDFSFDNVTIQNTRGGFYFDNLHLVRITDAQVTQSISGAMDFAFYCINTISWHIDRMVARALVGTFSGDIVTVDSNCDTCLLHKVEAYNGDLAGFAFRNSLGGGSDTGPRLVRVTDCYAEFCANNYLIEDCRDLRMTAPHAVGATNINFWIAGGDSITITSPWAHQGDGHGIHVTGGNDIEIVSPKCCHNSQGASNTYDGIRIEDNVTHCRIVGGRSGDYLFGLDKQRYGLSIGSTGTDYITIIGLDTTTNNSGGLANFSTGANNRILGRIKPTVYAEPSIDATNLTVSITAKDPDLMLASLEVAIKNSDGSWGSWGTSWDSSSGSVGSSASLTRTRVAARIAKHIAGIKWRYTYVAADGTTQTDGGHADADPLRWPVVGSVMVSFRSDDGIVVAATGDRDTGSFFVTTQSGSAPADPDNVTNDGGIAGNTGTVQTANTCAVGAIAHVKVVGYTGNGSGTPGDVVYVQVHRN